MKDERGNTPFLLATGTGVTSVVQVLIDAEADIHAQKERGVGALQRAQNSSRSMKAVLLAAGCEWTTGGRLRQRTTTTPARQSRYALSAWDRNSRWYKGCPGRGKGKGKRRENGKGKRKGEKGKGGNGKGQRKAFDVCEE